MKIYFLLVLAISFNTLTAGSKITIDKDCEWGDCNNGYGYKKYEDGGYEGFFSKGKKSGVGTYIFQSGKTYVGSFKDDKIQGFGFFSDPKGDPSSTIGNFIDGKLDGRGYKLMANKTVDAGVFESGVMNEFYEFIDNELDMGCTYGDCDEYYGRFKWETGDQFNGFFKNLTMEFGTYNFADNGSYIGSFDDKSFFTKVGIYVYPNGDYYLGSWLKSEFNGVGVFVSNDDNKAVSGKWKKGKLVKSF